MAIYTLGIETSCDETAAAVIKDGRIILSNVISSQILIHQKFGGVVPEIASRQHIENIMPVIEEALKQAGISLEDLSHIGVTVGPGLVGALLVGVSTAKALAYSKDIPLIGVNHMEGHIFANFLVNKDLEPPFLSLVVSGGHTMLVVVRDYNKFEILGETRDDAAGESFDKVARVMGYPYPGGPYIDKLAQSGNPDAIEFPKALNIKNNFEFSFSGIKSAVLNYINSCKMKNLEYSHEDLAASFQKSVIDILVEKTINAAKFTNMNIITVAGGVSANSSLQSKLSLACELEGFEFYKPNGVLYTDNAAMIACRAYYMAQDNNFATWNINANPSLKII